MLGQPGITQDPRFASQVARYRHGPEVRAVLEPLFTQADTATLERRCRDEGAALGRINERTDLLADPQVQHNGCAVLVANGDGDRVRVARSAARFDGTAMAPTRGAARLGEHSAEVLAELGYDTERIAALVASGAVRLHRGVLGASAAS